MSVKLSQSQLTYLQDSAVKTLNHWYQVAVEKGWQLEGVPSISLNVRGKVAGKALLTTGEIRLNPVLFWQNQQAFTQEVIPHELAHLIVWKYFGRVRPHGKEWQNIMVEVFSITPKTTHSFDISAVQGKQFIYQCDCTTHNLSIRRHNAVLKNQRVYLCKQCKTPLRLST